VRRQGQVPQHHQPVEIIKSRHPTYRCGERPAQARRQPSHRHTAPKSKRANGIEQFWPPLWSTFLPPFWSNWALVIVAGIAACFALRTLKAIQRQADIAERELVIANRAYLYLSGVRVTFLPSTAESNVEITYPVYNGGQTPPIHWRFFEGDRWA
jgi:hypothetical protein